MPIFRDDDDFRYMESLLARHLSEKTVRDKFGREYKNYYGRIQIHSFCLMPSHFHLLLWQKDVGDIAKFMSSVIIAYGMYFNKKHKRRGPLFESEYKAVDIAEDPQLMHVSRYIHLIPIGYRLWDHSSYSDFAFEPREFITTSTILSMFSGKQHYLDFIDDYEDTERLNALYKREIGK